MSLKFGKYDIRFSGELHSTVQNMKGILDIACGKASIQHLGCAYSIVAREHHELQ